MDFAAAILEGSPDLVVVVGDDGGMRWASSAATSMLGRPAAWLTGQPLAGIIHAEDRPKLARASEAARTPDGGGPAAVELRLSHLDGQWIETEVTVSDFTANPRVSGLVLTIRDATEQRMVENELRRMALHDSLTGLANRALFRDHAQHALAHRRLTRVCHAVLFIDLDGFKTINDSLGHAAGDEILMGVADRLRASVRPSDIIARLGGDEFAVLLENTSESDAAFLAGRVLELLRGPFLVQGKEVVMTGSAGIAFSGAALDADELLRNADVAMYQAKTAGKSRFTVYQPAMHLAALRRLDLEADLRRAIEGHELVLNFQPILHLGTGAMAGMEVLVRWQHPATGIIPPADFIPVAEDTGLIRPLGRMILEEACRTARDWALRYPVDPPLQICVNASVRQIEHDRFPSEVAACLEASGLDPASLTLEITESLFLSDVDGAISKLHLLKELGINLAIDDFGTGYSSLSYLRSLPIDVLKIDKSFVEASTGGPEQSAVARAIVKLAHTFGLHTVAEGIETPAQRRELTVIGADMGQGYLFAHPLDAGAMDALLHRRFLDRRPLPVVGARGMS